jgi:2-iminobutanoate/2-iminopropanoate deaminase
VPKKVVETQHAPRPIGPYAQGVISGGLLFISGQIPLDPESRELVKGDIAEQTEQVLKNIFAILREAKAGPENVVKTTIYLRDLGHFARVNEVYERYFAADRPARSTVQVSGLPAGAEIEIDAIAAF